MVQFKLTNTSVFFFFLVLWAALIALVNPFADFPLNDDWSYAYAVKSLAIHGDLEYRGWMSMTLFVQVLWGSLFVKIFGFSFTVLRFSTLVLAFLASFYSYKLFELLRIGGPMALLMAVVITLNPIFLNLSFTFMTDIPFYSFAIISIFALVKFQLRQHPKFLVIGTTFVVLAVLTRQLGLAIPLAFFLVGLYEKKWKMSIPLIFGIAAFVIYQYSIPLFVTDLGRSNEINQLFLNKLLNAPIDMFVDAVKRYIIFMVYVGLLFAPILIFLRLPKGIYVDWVLLLISIVSVAILYRNDFLMPMNKNILVDFGVGPRTLYDNWVTKETDLKSMLLISKIQVTFAGIMFGLKVIEGIFIKLFNLTSTSYQLRSQYLFIALIGLCYLVPVMAIDNFDRYYLLLFPMFLILISNFLSVRQTIWKAVQWVFMMSVLGSFGVVGNIDYLAWNRARWEGINYLKDELHVSTDKIDGGFEYNGWFNYNPTDYYTNVENIWVPDDEYKICYEQIEGYSVLKEIEYTEYLKFGRKKSIKVLKRNE